jgi:hypothetical protein
MSHSQRGLALCTTTFLLYSVNPVIVCLGAAVGSRAQNTPSSNTNESWTATTQSSHDNTAPSRTTESHATFGNRRTDKQHMELLGPNGDYQPYFDTEKETMEVNPTTTRTVVRTYSWDANRNRKLVYVTEEESRTGTSGDTHLLRTTSNPDANGNLQVVRREIVDTTNTSADTQQVQTTTYLADGNGGFTPSLQTRESQKRGADRTVEVNKKTLQPDPNGNWKISEVTESRIKEEGTTRTRDERVSRADLDGRLSEVSRTVAKETENAAGEQSNTVETYSVDVPGSTRDTALHLARRVTTVEKNNSGEKATGQLIEEPDPGNPGSGVRVTSQTSEVAHSGASGTQRTKIFQVRDMNGTFNIVAVQRGKTDQPPATQAQASSSAAPKP